MEISRFACLGRLLRNQLPDLKTGKTLPLSRLPRLLLFNFHSTAGRRLRTEVAAQVQPWRFPSWAHGPTVLLFLRAGPG